MDLLLPTPQQVSELESELAKQEQTISELEAKVNQLQAQVNQSQNNRENKYRTVYLTFNYRFFQHPTEKVLTVNTFGVIHSLAILVLICIQKNISVHVFTCPWWLRW